MIKKKELLFVLMLIVLLGIASPLYAKGMDNDTATPVETNTHGKKILMSWCE